MSESELGGLIIPAEIPRTWGESAAISGTTLDGEQGFGIRIARFPMRGTGNISGHISLEKQRLGFTSEGMALTEYLGLTEVRSNDVHFRVAGDATADLHRTALPDGRFRGEARAQFRAHAVEHPPVGPGDVPVTIEAVFIARHVPLYVRPGRMEVAGDVEARFSTPAGKFELKSHGKWHEQIGDRPRFGPAFTYMSVHGQDSYLLAGRNTRARYGFWEHRGQTVRVKEFEIEPLADRRKFVVTLEDGTTVEGEAVTMRSHSVPIEGQRRPGAFVVATTNRGELSGQLNDWNPEP
ncbi:MAG TPA: hypothetical protein VH951_11675 [Dehalococcoidia bacterium]|jgi:hypothetical protein